MWQAMTSKQRQEWRIRAENKMRPQALHTMRGALAMASNMVIALLDDLDSRDEPCRCEVAWDMPGADYCCKCGHHNTKEQHG